MKAMSDYARAVRGAIRGLWSDETTTFEFVDQMVSALTLHMTTAWYEGMRSVGVDPAGITPEETAALSAFINGQIIHLPGFADAIRESSKANGGKLADLFNRGEMWISRYDDARMQAATLAGADKAFEWVLGPTEHCADCQRLGGRVHRGSVWNAYGIKPRDSALACGGYRCQCELQLTDKKITPGRPPGLRG